MKEISKVRANNVVLVGDIVKLKEEIKGLKNIIKIEKKNN